MIIHRDSFFLAATPSCHIQFSCDLIHTNQFEYYIHNVNSTVVSSTWGKKNLPELQFVDIGLKEKNQSELFHLKLGKCEEKGQKKKSGILSVGWFALNFKIFIME